jgi:c-di-GMP-binding flagellar brake protein YcgR
MQEMRAFERVAVDIRALFRGGNGGNLRGHVCDISLGGMYIETATVQRIGSYILVDLDVESLGKIVWAQGRVVRVTSLGMAIEFARLDARGIQSLLEFSRPR